MKYKMKPYKLQIKFRKMKPYHYNTTYSVNMLINTLVMTSKCGIEAS